MTIPDTPRLSPADLQQFTGSDTWYRSINPAITYTVGAKHVADEGGAYWLLDEIALAQRFQPKVQAEEFQVWRLVVNTYDASAQLICGDGNGRSVYVKPIPYTDFPVAEITLYCTSQVILLPSEY
jgi:hypothetical protein